MRKAAKQGKGRAVHKNDTLESPSQDEGIADRDGRAADAAVSVESAASERVFSVGGLVVTMTRNRLSGDRVADNVFLHESMKHNLW